MSRFGMIKTVLSEYGYTWAVNRSLYSAKLKMLRTFSVTEMFFEKKNINVENIDIFDLDIEALQQHIKKLDLENQKNLIESADLAIEGKIKAFSSVLLDYENPIRWNYNPMTGKVADFEQKWYKIPDFDSDRGDVKVIWEPSRFSHLYLLSRAFLLTEDSKYYEAFHNQVIDWVNQNQYGYGPNYKCGQECALRMVNVLLNYTVFQIKGVTNSEDEKSVKQIIEDSYKKILSNFFYAYRCIKNNHTISELLGMVIGAWCCGDKNRLRSAYNKMNQVVDEQFFDDGGYRQFSFNYQRLALQDLECLISISKKTGYMLSEHVKQKLLKSVLLLHQCQSKDGNVPNYGSNDGALIFPVTSCGYRDFSPTIGGLYYLLTGKRLYSHGVYDEELLWFTGGGALKAEQIKVEKRSEAYYEAGLFDLREANTHLMVILNDFSSRPCQQDQMHLDLWIDSKNVFCDSGTYSYIEELGKNLSFTEGHNTVKINGIEQMNRIGAFMYYKWTKRKQVQFSENRFSGVMVSQNGYKHKREIQVNVNKQATTYLICDQVESMNDTGFEILFHTPYEVVKEKNGVSIVEDDQTLCFLKCTNGYTVKNVERSLFYLKREPIQCIRFQGQINKKNEIEIIISKDRRKNG